MTTEKNRRIDDIRPSVSLEWDESAAKPAHAPFEIPNRWTILLTSSNHGLVGAYGHEFPHASSDHVKVNVVAQSAVTELRTRRAELESAAPASADNPSTAGAAKLTDEEIQTIWQTMPGGPAGWLKSFGYLQFARAVEDWIIESGGSIAAPASQAQPSAAEVRDQALEEAIAVVPGGSVCDPQQVADAIRALKGQSALGEKGGE